MANSKISNDTINSNNAKRISSLKKYVTNSKTEIPIGGEVLKPAQVIAVFQASLDTRAAVTATQGQYKAALAEREGAEEKRKVADDALKGWVLNTFGAESAEAHEFGYAARKTGALSAAERANAVLLNQATRTARGTMGPKAKLKIKGTLVVPTAPAVPVNSAAPVAAVPATAAHVGVATASAPAAVIAAPATMAVPAVPAVNAPAAGGNA